MVLKGLGCCGILLAYEDSWEELERSLPCSGYILMQGLVGLRV